MSPFKRKLFRILFWIALIYTAISTTIVWGIQLGFIPTNWKNVQTESGKSQNTNRPVNWSEGSFAERFTREYLWWTVGNEDSRKKRLQPYLASNIDPSAGLDTNKANYHSYVVATDIWNISDRSGSSEVKEVTVYAEVSLTNAKDSDDVKRSAYYLVVPVMKAGDSFRVVDKPYFVAAPVAQELQAPKKEPHQGEVVDEAIHLQIDQFLNSFWENYFSGSSQELTYMVQSEKPINGFENTYEFVEMKDLKLSKSGDKFVANCNVTMSDPISGVHSTVHYEVHLTQEGNRWYVTQLKQGEV